MHRRLFRQALGPVAALCAVVGLGASALGHELASRGVTASGGQTLVFDASPTTEGPIPNVEIHSGTLGTPDARVAWSGPCVAVSCAPRMAAASDGRRTWLAQEQYLGGVRALQLWSLADGSVRSVMVRSARVSTTGATLQLDEAFAPALFEWRGTLCLVAGGRGGDRPWWTGSEAVWIARLDSSGGPSSTTIDADLVADGVDPRVLVNGTDVVLAVRVVQNAAELQGHAPVRFHRSRDLVTWTLDEELSTGVHAAANYDIGAALDGTLLVATTGVDDDTAVVLSRNAGDGDGWRREESALAGVTLPSSEDPLWLVDSAFGAELIYADGAGGLGRRGL